MFAVISCSADCPGYKSFEFTGKLQRAVIISNAVAQVELIESNPDH